MVTKDDYQSAYYSQGACNVSGLVMGLAEVLERIRKEDGALRGGTDYVNTHPIVRLYAEQIYHLARGRDYSEAYKICKEMGGVEE